MKPALRSNRAFVVWLDEDARHSEGRVSGRVEHVESGEKAHFASQRELDEFMARFPRERVRDADEEETQGEDDERE